MRYIVLIPALIVPAISFGQASSAVQSWAKDRFGVQIEFPTKSTAQNYARIAQPDGTFLIQPDGPSRPFNDPNCQPWQNAYSTLSVIPRGAWVRAGVNIWEHFLDPSLNMTDSARFLDAITAKTLYPNLPSTIEGLNLLWVMSPGIPNRYSDNDGWAGDPKTRDWFMPLAANRPALKAQVQKFVTQVNNYSANLAKPLFSGKITTNIVQRMGFQLGNELGAAHPGSSVFGNPGSWTGIGQVMQDTTGGITWRPDSTTAAILNGGTSWVNQINLPAFSWTTEDIKFANVSYTLYGQVKSIQWPGAVTPGLNEVFTYYDEVFGPTNNYTWANQAKRRSIHFRSPGLQWIRANDGQRVYWPDMSVTNGVLNGRWENAQEYAKRWVDEAALAIKGYGRLAMPGNPTVVDLTECYLTYGEMNAKILNPSNYQFAVNGVPKSPQQIRDDSMARGSSRDINGVIYQAPVPPTRISIFAAIRDELYNRSIQGKLPNLGRVFWVNGYTADPRRETGFSSVDPINSYNPYEDFRLSIDEIMTLYGKI
jgi:hypothetical protein